MMQASGMNQVNLPGQGCNTSDIKMSFLQQSIGFIKMLKKCWKWDETSVQMDDFNIADGALLPSVRDLRG